MVTSVTNLGRSGPYDWLIQRVSAVVLALYTLWLLGVVFFTSNMDYAAWSALFSHTGVRIFSLLALIALGAHAWIGLWTVSTDYLKHGAIRFVFQAGCGLIMFVYVVWGIQILWSL